MPVEVAMQICCQVLTLLFCVLLFFSMVHSDFHGRGSSEPLGFSGFIGSMLAIMVIVATLYGAGTFSLLIR